MRLQTKKGYEKSGVVKKPAAEPRCYVVQTGVEEYRRNRCFFFTYSLSYSSSTASNPVKCSSPGSYHVKWGYTPWVYNFPKTPPEPKRKFIRPKASLQSSLERGTPEVPSSNGPAYCNAIASCHKIWENLTTLSEIRGVCDLILQIKDIFSIPYYDFQYNNWPSRNMQNFLAITEVIC